jgi:hypothetical protein
VPAKLPTTARDSEEAAGRDGLAQLYAAMNEEFCRRARIAWTRAS